MQRQNKSYMKWLAILSLLGLCGCNGEALRHDYSAYSEVYAESFNRQLLLNLARLSQGEPEYFIQLGTISSQSQFTTAAGFAPSHTRNVPVNHSSTSVVQDVLTFGGSLTGGATETPVFSFVPLSGSQFANTIATPISDNVFCGFYDQGYHADILARTMVSSIEIDAPDGKGGHEFYMNNPHSSTYPKFLEYCNELQNAQSNHTLIVSRKPAAKVDVTYDSAPKMNEIASLVQGGLSVTHSGAGGQYSITKPQGDLELAVNNPPTDEQLYAGNMAPADAERSLKDAIAIAKDVQTRHLHFNMRTFESAMYAVARESGNFKRLMDSPDPDHKLHYKNIEFHDDGYGIFAFVTREDKTRFAVRPVLTIKYGYAERSHLSEMVNVQYRDSVYSVGDLREADFAQDPMWGRLNGMNFPDTENKTVFTLLSYLFSQAAIDPQKLPAQTLIQVQ